MVLEHNAGHDIPRDGEFVNAFAAAIRTMMGLSADQPMATSPANAATVTEPRDTKPTAKSFVAKIKRVLSMAFTFKLA
ncbi:hypothetical protein BC831DRAFT_454614, partial [Entophlyctis helioformis]